MDRLLIVEDDLDIRQFIRQVLEGSGYEVNEAATLGEGLVAVGIGKPDLIILDLGLPDGDGIELIRETRQWNRSPILVLSARASDCDKTRALDLGADDYLVKPFSSSELLARVRASLRRAHRPEAERASVIHFGECEFDQKARVVRRKGRQIHLTQVEFKLLAILVTNERQVFTHRQLLRVVWGPAASEHVHYLRIYMGHLRRKLEIHPARPAHFLTEIGVGYRFVPHPPTEPLADDPDAAPKAIQRAGAKVVRAAVGRLDEFVPQDHILRSISDWVSTNWPLSERRLRVQSVPESRSADVDIDAEPLVRALLLQVLYRIPTDRQLIEQINYNMLYRWFVGLAIDDVMWQCAHFCTQRDELIGRPAVQAFVHKAFEMLDCEGHLVGGHFLVDRALLQEWRHRLGDAPLRSAEQSAAHYASETPPGPNGACESRAA